MEFKFRIRHVAMSLVLGIAAAASTVCLAKPAAEEKTGVKVGQKAPEFQLTGHDGKQHTLADLCQQGNVALVFYRSADW